MSSRSSARLLLIGAVALAVSACDREEHHSRAKPVGESVPAGESPQTIFPGSSRPPALDVRAKLFDNNANAISQGQQLYMRMNCVGCHSHGGGGMGPPLMDDEWRYGSRIDQIATTIAEGRPNGMPSWRGKLTEDQIWDLAAYVRSLSGLPSKDAVSSRAEEMSGPTPQTLTPKPETTNSDAVPQQ
jgi:cytochrome c oxidase cbb3-type subunit 3